MDSTVDTIVAIATPPGRGGIGIVRLSGPAALAIAVPMLRLRNPLAPGRARFAAIVDPATATVLDEGVATWFAAPHTYTGDDIVEIAAHGSPVLLELLVTACLRAGARLAEPGEFTQRAFLAGRIDLTQAEAVHDLIAANTLEQARVAAGQLGGSLSRAVAPVKQTLVRLIAGLEAGIDFVEDDLDLMPVYEIVTQIEAVVSPLQALAASYAYGRIVREGFSLAIVGRPNAGKSSLFNRLLGRDRAIVTATPGTTRDTLAERLSLDGIPVEVIDTAGLRDAPEDEAERLGIARSGAAMAEADVILVVVDAALGLHPDDLQTLNKLRDRTVVVAANKSDLAAKPLSLEVTVVQTSALTGEGIEDLRAAIVTALGVSAPAGDAALVTSLRQRHALDNALQSLAAAHTAAQSSIPHEMLLLDLYAALEALDRLTGATSADDVLHLIFSTFCIGK